MIDGRTVIGNNEGIGGATADMFFGVTGVAPASSFIVNSKADASGTNWLTVDKSGAVTVPSVFRVGTSLFNYPVTIRTAPDANLIAFDSGSGVTGFGPLNDAANAWKPLDINSSNVRFQNGPVSMAGAVTCSGGLTVNNSALVVNATANISGIVTVGGLNVNNGIIRFAGDPTGKYIYHDGTQFNLAGGRWNMGSNPLTCGGITSADMSVTGQIAASGLISAGGNLWANGGTCYLNGAATAYLSYGGGALTVRTASGAAISITDGDGRVQLGSGMVTRAGRSGAYDPNYSFNSQWTGSSHILYINETQTFAATPSDYRVKRDVIDLPGMWDTVKSLRPIKYKHKAHDIVTRDDTERWGFVAHELQDSTTKDAASGEKDGDTLQFPNQMTVIAALTKALQEAMARIEALEAK